MRILLISAMLFLIIKNCTASVDDSLPRGVSSRFLTFPFILRSPETSWGFGGAGAFFFKAKKNEENLRTSDINLIGLYTLQKQTVIVLGSTVFFTGEREIFRFQSSFSNYPDRTWGLGNDSPESAKEKYSLKQIFFNPQLIFKLYKNLFIGAGIEIQDITDFSYTAGGVFDRQNIKGKSNGLASGAGIIFTWDSRNNAYSPGKGNFAEINITKFSEKLSSDFDFVNYQFDFRKYVSAGKNTVVGFHSLTKIAQGSTPIRYLSMLGGPEIMRGYYKGRYTDQNLFALQSEIRQYLFWRLGVAGFTSIGQVSDRIGNFGINDFHYTYGAGLRLIVQEKEKLNLRVDFGFGKNSHGVYVILKEAF